MRQTSPSFKPLDPGRVNSVDPVEVAWWCGQFGCTEAQLRTLLAEVGEHVTEIRERLAHSRTPAPEATL